jgi:hypothetical protein
MKTQVVTTILFLTLAPITMAAPKIPFAEEDFAAYVADGKATLEGEAFGKTRGGEVKTCAGEKVLLAPDTDYDVQVITAFLFVDTKNTLRMAGPAAKYWKETICDSQGKFTFEDLPAGKWIVITSVRFQISDLSNQGGLMAKRVTTIDNKKVKVIIPTENGQWNYFSHAKWIDNS